MRRSTTGARATVCRVGALALGSWAAVSFTTTPGAVAQDATTSAATSTASDSAATDRQRGLAALGAGRADEAVTALEASYAAQPEPAALFDLGTAYAAAGRPHAAVQAFDRFLDAAPGDANAATARAERERLMHASCVIVPTLAPANAVVVVDERVADPWRGQILLAPGLHELVVRADGHRTHAQRIDAVQGRFLIEITLVPEPVAAPTPAQAVTPVAPVAPAAPTTTTPVAPSAAPTTEPTTSPSAEPAPTPQSTPEPAPAPTDEPAPRDTRTAPPDEDVHCAAGSWCMGPLVTGGLPALVGPGFHVRAGEYVGFGIDFQLTPTLGIGDGKLSLYTLAATARVYPIGGAFFLAAGVTLYHASGSATATDATTGEALVGEGNVSFPGLVFALGVLNRQGFVFGIDFTAIVPLASTRLDFEIVRGDPTSPLAMTAQNTVTDTVDKALDTLPFIPQLNLLRLGYLF